MFCHEVNENIYAYCDGTLSPGLNSKITQHLAECDSCRSYYQITMAETEALKDTADIPELAPDFTAMVINSLESAPGASDPPHSRPAENKSFSSLPRPWYLTLVAAAAVIALCLYLPLLYNAGSPVKMAENDNYSTTPILTAPVIADSPTLDATRQVVPVPAVAAPRASNSEVKSATSQAETPLVKDKLTTAPTQTTTASDSANLAASQLQSAAPMMEQKSAPIAAVPAYIPQNLPARWQLVEMDVLSGTGVVYHYSSRDEQDQLQISMAPYGPTSGTIPPLARIVEIDGAKIMVTFSGNLSSGELELLANTVQFESAGLNKNN